MSETSALWMSDKDKEGILSFAPSVFLASIANLIKANSRYFTLAFVRNHPNSEKYNFLEVLFEAF